MENNGANHELFKKKLIELGSLLGQLPNTTRVVWLNQYPTVDFYGGIGAHNTDIYAEKIHHYNKASRRILEYVHYITFMQLFDVQYF